jgi:hypothetical protein
MGENLSDILSLFWLKYTVHQVQGTVTFVLETRLSQTFFLLRSI